MGDKTKIFDAVSRTTSWLDSNQTAEKEEFEAKQKGLEGICLPILQNLGGGAGGMPGGMPDMGAGGFPGGFPVEGHKVLDLLRLPTTDRRLRRLTEEVILNARQLLRSCEMFFSQCIGLF